MSRMDTQAQMYALIYVGYRGVCIKMAKSPSPSLRFFLNLQCSLSNANAQNSKPFFETLEKKYDLIRRPIDIRVIFSSIGQTGDWNKCNFLLAFPWLQLAAIGAICNLQFLQGKSF